MQMINNQSLSYAQTMKMLIAGLANLKLQNPPSEGTDDIRQIDFTMTRYNDLEGVTPGPGGVKLRELGGRYTTPSWHEYEGGANYQPQLWPSLPIATRLYKQGSRK